MVLGIVAGCIVLFGVACVMAALAICQVGQYMKNNE